MMKKNNCRSPFRSEEIEQHEHGGQEKHVAGAGGKDDDDSRKQDESNEEEDGTSRAAPRPCGTYLLDTLESTVKMNSDKVFICHLA